MEYFNNLRDKLEYKIDKYYIATNKAIAYSTPIRSGIFLTGIAYYVAQKDIQMSVQIAFTYAGIEWCLFKN